MIPNGLLLLPSLATLPPPPLSERPGSMQRQHLADAHAEEILSQFLPPGRTDERRLHQESGGDACARVPIAVARRRGRDQRAGAVPPVVLRAVPPRLSRCASGA